MECDITRICAHVPPFHWLQTSLHCGGNNESLSRASDNMSKNKKKKGVKEEKVREEWRERKKKKDLRYRFRERKKTWRLQVVRDRDDEVRAVCRDRKQEGERKQNSGEKIETG